MSRSNFSAKVVQYSMQINSEDLTVIADAGYFKRVDILSCQETGVTANAPRSQNLGSRTKGFFGERRVIRWQHEAILETMQERLNCDPEVMQVRR